MNFNDCELQINGIKLTAINASLSQNSSIEDIATLNTYKVGGYVVNNYNSNLSISYYLEPLIDPNFLFISGWRDNSVGNNFFSLRVGDMYASGYLSDYSITISENRPATASASYKIYQPVSGSISSPILSSQSGYNVNRESGIAHSWTTYLYSGNTYDPSIKVTDINYSISFDIQPITTLGSKYPKYVSIISAKEEIGIKSFYELNLSASTTYQTGIIGNSNSIRMYPLSSLWNTIGCASLGISEMVITSHTASISDTDILTSDTKLVKSY